MWRTYLPVNDYLPDGDCTAIPVAVTVPKGTVLVLRLRHYRKGIGCGPSVYLWGCRGITAKESQELLSAHLQPQTEG